MNNEVKIRSMVLDDYEDVIRLMRSTAGMTIRSADSREAIGTYLERNPGLSLVAERDEELIACVLCGHDGRRGYLHHVVVAQSYRGRGIGRDIISKALDGLATAGILKTHIDVYADNHQAIGFWEAIDWEVRSELVRMSYIRSDDRNI